jgi:hypothetical protein
METFSIRGRFRFARVFSILFVSALIPVNAVAPQHGVAGDELEVWNAMAGAIARENTARPFKLWFFRSDFTAAPFIATAMDDPDREEFCGLSGPDSQAMIAQLKAANASPVLLDSKTAEAAGFRLVREKNPVLRYFALSRVAFNPTGDSAWLSVELSSERGSIARLDKVEGEWKVTSRCAGWYMPR